MSTQTNSTALANAENVSERPLSAFGNFNYDQMIAAMPAAERSACLEKAQSIDPNNLGSIRLYGSDLSNRINTAGDVLLKKTYLDRDNEVMQLTGELLSQLRIIDVNQIQDGPFKRWLKKIPFMKNLMRSTQELMEKTDTVLEKVVEISKQIGAVKSMADADNAVLIGISENIREYLDEIRHLIVGAKLRLQELEEEKKQMEQNGADVLDIQHINNVISSLKKRIDDMIGQEYIFNQDAMHAEMLMKNNYDIGDCAENIKTNIIPAIKTQVSKAVAIEHQRHMIEANGAVRVAFNEMLIKNSESIKENAIEVARQSETPFIEIETIDKCASDLIEAMEQINQIRLNGEKNHALYEAKMLESAESINKALRHG